MFGRTLVVKIKVWSVSQVNSYIRSIIDGDILLNSFFAEGELSNVKLHTSGHIYFTLKDGKSSINCVMFKTYADSLTFAPKDGMKVVVCGYVSFFEKTGQVQLYAEMIESVGKGSLYVAFEQLKQKLQDDGLFDPAHKKSLPAFPKCIAVITSITGAAVQDIIDVITRRNKCVKIVILPVLVQGENAPAEIVSAIKQANAWAGADAIILGRGGGSIEDLWAFNDEMVARSIYSSNIPVISAVGHETDFTIADFVADLRAPTPSAAAELAVPELDLITEYVFELENRMTTALSNKTNAYEHRLKSAVCRKAFANPLEIFNAKKKLMADLYKTMNKEINYRLDKKMNQIGACAKLLENSSPLKVLSRGYTITYGSDGKIISSINGVDESNTIKIRFKDGTATAIVDKKELDD